MVSLAPCLVVTSLVNATDAEAWVRTCALYNFMSICRSLQCRLSRSFDTLHHGSHKLREFNLVAVGSQGSKLYQETRAHK